MLETLPVKETTAKYFTNRGNVVLYFYELISQNQNDIIEYFKSKQINLQGVLLMIDFLTAMEQPNWLKDACKV
jgi:hypothetical protein